MNSDRSAPQTPLIIIPARLAATRLPRKPLALIGSEAMIVHVWRRGVESGIGRVVVACDGPEIASVIEAAGGEAILTDPLHPSGSDRVFEALTKVGGSYDAIINLQGDLPTMSAADIQTAWDLLQNPDVDIGTLAVDIKSTEERDATHVVKAVIDMNTGERKGRALYFTRVPAPFGAGPLYHHIGIYAFRRDALHRFVGAKPSPLEQREKLEQLRALSLGMRIEVGLVDEAPFGVDTPPDLERARKMLGA